MRSQPGPRSSNASVSPVVVNVLTSSAVARAPFDVQGRVGLHATGAN
jgi:hypothetical protein